VGYTPTTGVAKKGPSRCRYRLVDCRLTVTIAQWASAVTAYSSVEECTSQRERDSRLSVVLHQIHKASVDRMEVARQGLPETRVVTASRIHLCCTPHKRMFAAQHRGRHQDQAVADSKRAPVAPVKCQRIEHRRQSKPSPNVIPASRDPVTGFRSKNNQAAGATQKRRSYSQARLTDRPRRIGGRRPTSAREGPPHMEYLLRW